MPEAPSRPLGDIDRADGEAARFHRLDKDGGLPADGTRKAGPEDRIDNHSSPIQAVGREWRESARPLARRASGFAREFFACAQQGHLHRPARRIQMTGDDKAVAAIVSRSTQDRDRTHRPALADGDRDRAAGRLHHRGAAGAGGLGRAIGLSHLGGRQEHEVAVFDFILGDHVHPPASIIMAAFEPPPTGSESTQLPTRS